MDNQKKYFLFFVFSFFINTQTNPVARTVLVCIHKDSHSTVSQETMDQLVDAFNALLEKDGKIMPLNITPKNRDEAPFIEYAVSVLYYWYYKIAFARYSFAYPEKYNRSFIYEHSPKSGVYSIFVPDGVALHHGITLLEELLKKNGICATVEKNHTITLDSYYDTFVTRFTAPQGYPLLDGKSLTSLELEELTKHTDEGYFNKRITDFLKQKAAHLKLPSTAHALVTPHLSLSEKKWIKQQEYLQSLQTKAGLYITWWQAIPTVGMRQQAPFWPLTYPFIPHMFSLWDLAPAMGKGENISFIDTGIAAFALDNKHLTNNIKKNQNLSMRADFADTSYNFVPLTQDILSPKQSNIASVTITSDSNAQKNIPLEHIPLAFIADTTMNSVDQKIATYTSGHGSHTAGIACGSLVTSLDKNTHNNLLDNAQGMFGIAPYANPLMFKAFLSETRASTLATIIRALEQVVSRNTRILNMSMKIADVVDHTQPSIATAEKLLAEIPYTVASTGNALKKYTPKDRETFPAQSSKVTFDIGAFSFYEKDGNYFCPIPEWSRYQPEEGPKFVEPGQNILSAGLIPQQVQDSMYVFMQGTSAATALVSGFIALALSQFKNVFTHEREVLLTTAYASGIFMHDTPDWKTKTVFGTLDFRLALFTLHVLEALQKKKINLEETVSLHQYIALIHTILFSFVNDYGAQQGNTAFFRTNFMGYFNDIRKKPVNNFYTALIQKCSTVQEAVTLIVELILAGKSNKNNEMITKQVQEEITDIMNDKTYNLFKHIPEKAQKRIQQVLKDTKNKV